MKLAVMQHYLFLYISYFQLIYPADVFFIYDDVTHTKQSYLNRNLILFSIITIQFAIPVPEAYQNKLI